MPDPAKNTAYTISLGLIDRNNRPEFKINPTLASGDFKVSIDNGAFSNLATLPTVTPAGGIKVMISLSQAEMNGDRIDIQCIDAVGNEWDDVFITINTTINTVDTGVALAANSITDAVYNRIRGTVQTDAGNSVTQFKTDLASSVDNFYNDAIAKFTSGSLTGQVKQITGYVGATKILTFLTGFTSIPSSGDTFDIINF